MTRYIRNDDDMQIVDVAVNEDVFLAVVGNIRYTISAAQPSGGLVYDGDYLVLKCPENLDG